MNAHDGRHEVAKLAESLRYVSDQELQSKIDEISVAVNNLRSHDGIISLPEYQKLFSAYKALKKVLRFRNGFPLETKHEEHNEQSLFDRARERKQRRTDQPKIRLI